MAEHVPTVKTALKYFDQLLISFHSSEYTAAVYVLANTQAHLNPRQRRDGKHSLKVNIMNNRIKYEATSILDDKDKK
jgi:hypothetical protein